MSHSNNSEKHIKAQIKETINNTTDFAGYSTDTNRYKFSSLANKFIDAETYDDSIKCAKKLYNFVLGQNGKGHFASIINILDHMEMDGDYSYTEQRRHYVHQVNVYLLGLFLYHKCETIKNNFDRIIESTKYKIPVEIDNDTHEYQYSGGEKFSEFCYLWKLASLTHDIGYGVSLFGNDDNKMIDYIKKFGVTNIQNINDLWFFEDTDLRLQLQYTSGDYIVKYADEQYKLPPHESDYYDHGIISSLIFLRCMKQEYAKHKDGRPTQTDHGYIIWDERILSGSIRRVAIALAHHNLDNKKLESIADGINNFDLEEDPLSWLLKVSDIIQEWDKPKAQNPHENTERSSINISFEDNQISVENLPEKVQKEVQDTISKYTSPPGLIEIIVT